MVNNKIAWHTRSVDEALTDLKTDGKNGLSDAEAKSRIEKYGYNELIEEKVQKRFAVRLEREVQLLGPETSLRKH